MSDAQHTYDVAVIGAGAAGLAAVAECAANGLRSVVIDREPRAGGILRQCIHNGFGLRYFKQELTGPEYADLVAEKAVAAGAEFKFNATVTDIAREENGAFCVTVFSPDDGVTQLRARTVMLAMGCRERNRGNIATPGDRPAGIFTAGSAQRLLNIEGLLPGRSAVVVGSGDIGLIMARRLVWSGIAVKAVVEIMPYAAGLPRNVAQCLDDFGIPLYLEHSVTKIVGRDRVERVEISPLANGVPVEDKTFSVDCDTVLFSVGLVPENELSRRLGVTLNPATGGVLVDEHLQTTVPGVFAGGNVLHVHDLVDFVSEEAARAAQSIVKYLRGELKSAGQRAFAGANLKYAIPDFFTPHHKTLFAFRPLIVCDAATLAAEQNGKTVWTKKLKFVKPAEMIFAEFEPDAGDVTFHLNAEDKQ